MNYLWNIYDLMNLAELQELDKDQYLGKDAAYAYSAELFIKIRQQQFKLTNVGHLDLILDRDLVPVKGHVLLKLDSSVLLVDFFTALERSPFPGHIEELLATKQFWVKIAENEEHSISIYLFHKLESKRQEALIRFRQPEYQKIFAIAADHSRKEMEKKTVQFSNMAHRLEWVRSVSSN